jgi:hypothetical protein
MICAHWSCGMPGDICLLSLSFWLLLEFFALSVAEKGFLKRFPVFGGLVDIQTFL